MKRQCFQIQRKVVSIHCAPDSHPIGKSLPHLAAAHRYVIEHPLELLTNLSTNLGQLCRHQEQLNANDLLYELCGQQAKYSHRCGIFFDADPGLLFGATVGALRQHADERLQIIVERGNGRLDHPTGGYLGPHDLEAVGCR